MEAGHLERVENDGVYLGHITPDQTLCIPAPEGMGRAYQVGVVVVDHAFLRTQSMSTQSLLAAPCLDAHVTVLLPRGSF